MRSFVTTLMFAGASILGTIGIVTYADPAIASTPVIAVHNNPANTDGKAKAYARAANSLDQEAPRPVEIAAR
jgi:hypothetical protein